ncbi:MAG: putative sulfate exporter family transporter, partial [Bacteroidetes bacterium]|nr:putative sulfate exporter family transporter [Bacteroidota bacterium]
FVFKSKDAKVKIPYFIGLFVLAIIVNTYINGISKISPYIVEISKAGLKLTLFLIGTGLSSKLLKSVGLSPVIQGLLLWCIISIASLLSIMYL